MAGPVVRPGCDPGRGSTPPPTVRACRRVWRRSPGLPGHRRVGCVGCGSRSTVAGGWLPSLVPSWRRRRGGSGGWTGPRRWTPGGSSCPASRPTRPPWSRCSPGDRRSSCSTGRTTGSAARSSAKGSDAQQRRRPVSEMLAPLTPGPAVAGRPRRRAAVLGPGQAARGSPGPAAPLAHRRPAVHRRRRARDVPAGGVGINLAIQDAVAAARLLAGPLRRGVVTPAELARVRRRRLPATVAIQGLQRILHQTALRPALEGTVDLAATSTPPLPLRLVQRSSLLQRIPTYLVARGVRPERAPQFARRAPQPVTS